MYVVGKIMGCFGIRGYVKVLSYTHSPDRLKEGLEVFIGDSAGKSTRFSIEDVSLNRMRASVKLRGIDDRTSAENIVGNLMFVQEEEVAEAPEGSYFVHDIVGCDAWSEDETFLGTVEEVYKLPGHDLWAIRDGQKLHLVPAVKEFIRDVDTKKRRVTVRVIEGLIEK